MRNSLLTHCVSVNHAHSIVFNFSSHRHGRYIVLCTRSYCENPQHCDNNTQCLSKWRKELNCCSGFGRVFPSLGFRGMSSRGLRTYRARPTTPFRSPALAGRTVAAGPHTIMIRWSAVNCGGTTT